VPARFRSAPPAQERSRETVDRLVEAVEELLLTRMFEDISIQDIVRRAGRSVGSFYARFGSKEALLPHLYQRYHDRLEASLHPRFQRVAWEKLDLRDTVAALVDWMIATYDERRGLIRVLALFARTHPDALPADVVAHRRRIYEPFVEVLLRHRAHIRHPDPEAGARYALYLASCVVREKILFGDAPHSRITPLTREALRQETSRALLSYLTSEVLR
jgi:AcrR family transcriptional regulator